MAELGKVIIYKTVDITVYKFTLETKLLVVRGHDHNVTCKVEPEGVPDFLLSQLQFCKDGKPIEEGISIFYLFI